MLLSVPTAFREERIPQGRWAKRFSPCQRQGAYTTNAGVPKNRPLSDLVQEHLETFLGPSRAGDRGRSRFVDEEFDTFLECGISWPTASYACVAPSCAPERLVAFSCKRRGFCPSCGARRMAATAARLVDHVIPRVPMGQYPELLALANVRVY
jgi:hypothetical protein